MNALWIVCLTLASLEEQGRPQPTMEQPAIRLMDARAEQAYRQLLPEVDDPHLAAVLESPSLILYTEREIPRAYQFFDGAFPGIHSAYYNISANDSEPFGNGNREFPWGEPAGTHRAANVKTFRFLHLPRDEQGRLRPIVWHNQGGGYAWTYPVGAVVGEVLSMRGPDGYDYTFELRIREREVGDWSVDVFRPFPSADDLVRRIKELRPDWQAQPSLGAVVEHLTKPLPAQVFTLTDQQPGQRVFAQRAAVDELPSLGDDKLVAELLKTTVFRSAHSTAWRLASQSVSTAAPTTKADFHIVPANYDAGFVEVDRQSCRRCHQTTNRSVDQFNAGRDWYGRIRGSDGIFSFHPFARESISGNGYTAPVSLRSEFERAGVLAKFDAQRHPHSVYNTIRQIQ